MSTPTRAVSRRAVRPTPKPAPKAQSAKAAPSKPPQARSAKARPKPAAPEPRRSPRPQPRSSAPAGAATALAAPSPRRAPRPAAPSLEVVAEPRRSRRLRLVGGLTITFLFAVLLGLAVFHSMLVQGQLGIDRADDQIEQEQMRQRELRKQVAALEAPERIVAEATARGMVQPENRAYVPAVVPGTVVPPPEAGE